MHAKGTFERAIEVASQYARDRRKQMYVIKGLLNTFVVCEVGHADREDAVAIFDHNGEWVEGPAAKSLPIGYHSNPNGTNQRRIESFKERHGIR